MKNFFKFLSLAITFIISTSGNIFADGFNTIHTSDGTYIIAVGDQGNIFRSVNGGSSWAKYTEPTVNFKSVYSLGNDVWLTGDDGKVYKSSKITNALTPYSTGVTTSVNSIHFLNSNSGFVCGDNGLLMSTITGGTTWIPSNTGIPAGIKLNAISFKDLNTGIVVGENGKAYVTVNGGLTWTPETVPTTRNLLDAKYFNDGIVVTGEWGTLLTKTGSAWSSVNTRINTDIRGVTGSSMSDVYVCGGGGFIRNNKNGSSDFKNFEINPMLANLVDIIYYGNMGFAVSSLNNAIIRTTDAGATWSLPSGTSVLINWQAKPGATGGSLGDNLCVHPTNRNTIFTNFSGRTYVSRDRGETWSQVGTQIPSGNTPHSFYVSSVDTNVFLCAIESSGGDKIARSTDYGQTWTTAIQKNFSNYGEPLQVDQNNPSVFYFGPDNGGFYKSSNNGETFTEISNAYPFRSPCDLMVGYDASNEIYLADGITSSGLADLFKSVNGGANWERIFINTSSSEIPTMSNTVFDNQLIWFTNWPSGNIYKSTNGGANVSLNHTNGFSGWGSDICDEDPNFIMTGSWSGGNAGLSTDGGVTWNTINGLSGSGGVMKLVDRGYAVGQAGSTVYKLNVQFTVITAISENNISNIPKDFNLSQNYPNPFNPTTNIKFDIPKSGNVILKVYNELGKEVNTLVNSFRTAGTYEINFEASALSSGIYFYTLNSDGLTATKKMLLVK